jgi:hypothetical protein
LCHRGITQGITLQNCIDGPQSLGLNLVIEETGTQFDDYYKKGFESTYAADMDNDGGDELVVHFYKCDGGCYDRIQVFKIVPTGNNVYITETFSFVGNYKFGIIGTLQIADINNDNLKDIFIVNRGGKKQPTGRRTLPLFSSTQRVQEP